MFSQNKQPSSILYDAARAGNIDEVKRVLDQFRANDLKPDRGTVAAAIKSGNVELVKYFKNEFNLSPKSGLMEATCDARSFDMAKYLVAEFPEVLRAVDNTITWAAARTGDLEFLKFYLKVGRPFIRVDEGTLYDAVRGGSLEMVKFIVEECGISDVAEAHDFALKVDKSEIYDYLNEQLHKKSQVRM